MVMLMYTYKAVVPKQWFMNHMQEKVQL